MTTPDIARARRIIGPVTMAAAVVAWWPAFTLGAWGGVFFEQILTLWAAATAAFVVVLFKEGERRVTVPVMATLLLPSLWIALSFLPVADGTLLSEVLTWFGVAITVIGLPYMVWVILQVSRPDITEAVVGRTWVVAGLAVLAVALLSFTLGRLHPRFLTCEDFKISGNDVPANCTPGQSSLRAPPSSSSGQPPTGAASSAPLTSLPTAPQRWDGPRPSLQLPSPRMGSFGLPRDGLRGVLPDRGEPDDSA